jgi:hypothetical protein
MYVTTQTKHNAIAQASAQLFRQFYETNFQSEYPSEIDFLKEHVFFITLTLNPEKVSLVNNVGFSTTQCFYQDIIDERASDPWQLSSMEFSQLVGFSKRHKLDIDEPHKLSRSALLQAIQTHLNEPIRERLARNPNASLIGNPILQRPLIAIPPKPHPLKVFEHLHFLIARSLLGNNIQRKTQYQPLALAYVDFESTRYGASIDPIISSWPHVHAVMLIRPQHVTAFEILKQHLSLHFKSKKQQRRLNTFKAIEAQRPLTATEQTERLQLVKVTRTLPIMKLTGDLTAIHDFKCGPYNDDHPLAELIGYSSKGADHVPTHFVRHNNSVREAEYAGARDLYAVFPKQLASTSELI